jgi:hypothetical protein
MTLTGHEILDLPLQAVIDSDSPRTIRGFLADTLWSAWHQGEAGVHTANRDSWREEMQMALRAAGPIPDDAESSTVTDLIDLAIRAMNEPHSGVEFDDIREGDMVRATVSGRAAFGTNSGVYLRGEGGGFNSAWVCQPVCGEPVTFERLKSVARGVSPNLLADALDALAAAHPERSCEVADARSVIANRIYLH